MDRLAQAVQITAQLEDANRSARAIFGAEYEAKAEKWRRIVRGLMALWKCSALQVPPMLHRKGDMPENPLLLLAAVVDVVREAEGRATA